MKSLEALIRNRLIPAILGGREVSDELRSVLRLPARFGGMGFLDPSEEADLEYNNSVRVTAQLADHIFEQKSELQIDEKMQENLLKELRSEKAQRWIDQKEQLTISAQLSYHVSLASEKGASVWLTTLPLKSHGFRLSKQQFWDALCMRYDLKLKDVSRACQCGEPYSINHCLTCRKGGYVIMRHNVIRDTIAELLQETCKDVRIEPQLQPVTGELLPASVNCAVGARADVSAIGIWQPLQRAFIDVKVFNPHALTNVATPLSKTYLRHENDKKREYNMRIVEVEKGTFTPAIFSCSGGASPETSRLLKEIATKLAVKRKEAYSNTISFVRRRIAFDLLRTCTISFRGERGSKRDLPIEELDIGMQPMELY